MKCLTKKALWPHDEKCWSSLFRFCRDHGTTLSRRVVKVYANTDFQGGLTDELTETRTTEHCSAGFVFKESFALRQASNDNHWEVIEDYLTKDEKVVLQIRCWDDLAIAADIDKTLAEAIKAKKAAYRAKMDALLDSLPEPNPEPNPEPKPKVDFINDEVVDWSDFDEDDSYWG